MGPRGVVFLAALSLMASTEVVAASECPGNPYPSGQDRGEFTFGP